MGATGVDEQSAYIMKYSSGALFVGSSAIRTHTSQSAWIYGTRGRIHFPNQFWKSQSFECHIDGKESQTVSLPYEGNGYQFSHGGTTACGGSVESLIMPHAQSLALIQTMDTIRAMGRAIPWKRASFGRGLSSCTMVPIDIWQMARKERREVTDLKEDSLQGFARIGSSVLRRLDAIRQSNLGSFASWWTDLPLSALR